MGFGTPPASMGFTGYAQFAFPNAPVIIRATSMNVMLSQKIDTPNVMDGRWDRSLYQLGAQEVGGSVAYPAIMERQGGFDPTARLFFAMIYRNMGGDLFGQLSPINIFNLLVSYAPQFATFTYNNCIINTFKYSVEQGGEVNINVDVIGLNRQDGTFTPVLPSTPGFPQNARIVTWNDAVINITNPDYNLNITGAYIRNFNITYNNNAERFYTLNGQLFPQDIAVKKRDINGEFVTMGRQVGLAQLAQTNQNRCYESSQVQFGYSLTESECNSTFLATAPNVVFEIEQLELTTDLFQTTVQFHIVPDPIDLSTSQYLSYAGNALAIPTV